MLLPQNSLQLSGYLVGSGASVAVFRQKNASAKQAPLHHQACTCIRSGAEDLGDSSLPGNAVCEPEVAFSIIRYSLVAEHRRELTCRHLSGAPASSRYAFRFASTLPDWTSSSADADPAGAPVDLQEPWSQAPGDANIIAQIASPALDGPIGAAISLIDGLHAVTGLPWWATVSVTAVGTVMPPAANSFMQIG